MSERPKPLNILSDAWEESERLRLTDAEREAVEIAIEYVGSAYQVEHHAATLRGLLDRHSALSTRKRNDA